MTASFKRNIKSRLTSMEGEILRSIEEERQEYMELAVGDTTEETDEASIRNDERALATLLSHDEQRLSRVQSALGRIENGHYGICAVCGNAIGEVRLSAQPETLFCYECARKRERNAHAARLN